MNHLQIVFKNLTIATPNNIAMGMHSIVEWEREEVKSEFIQ